MAKKSIFSTIANAASRAYDFINPLDNGLTATQRTPTSNKSALSQAAGGVVNVVKSVAKPLAQAPLDVGDLTYNHFVAPAFHLPQQQLQTNPILGGISRAAGADGSVKQAVGSGIQTALTLGTGGLDNVAERAGASLIPETAPKIITSLAPKVATGAAVGGGFNAGAGISEGHTAKQVLTRDLPVGAAVGAALPVAAEGTRVATKAAADTLAKAQPLDQSGKVLVTENGSAIPTLKKITTRPTGQLNTNRFDLSDQAKAGLTDTVNANQAAIKEKTGGPMSVQSVVDQAKLKAGDLYNTGRNADQTLESAAKLKNTRDRVAQLQAKSTAEGGLSSADQAELVQHTLTVASRQADIARQLGALRATASPQEKTLLDSALAKLAKQGHDVNALIDAAKNYDLNDPKQLTQFYRTFDKATKEDWLDKIRYSSMLSSPITHIRNLSANLVGGTTVAPATKIVAGGLDALHSAATGKVRTRFAGEVAPYAKGYASSFGNAAQAFGDVMSGRKLINNPDVNLSAQLPLATGGGKGVLDSILGVTGKLMEGADAFGSELAQGGERAALKYREGKGVKVTDLEGKAKTAADYQLFRGELGGKDQGHLLNALDFGANKILEARTSDNPLLRRTAKLAAPFVKTPVNILKQMIEYSPLGVATTYGAADKTAQLAKAITGTFAVATTGAALAAHDALTFSAPTDKAQKEQFYREGKQPYSVKIDGHWISYQYLHPAISFQLAGIASVKNALDSGKIDDPTAEKVLSGLAGASKFLIDQSYFKNGQDFVNGLQGQGSNLFSTATSTAASTAANTASQVIPFRALATWIDNLTDSTQRTTDYNASFIKQFGQNLTKQLPGLSKNAPALTNSDGTPTQKQHPLINAISPAKVSTDTGGKLSDIVTPSGSNPKKQQAYKDAGLNSPDATKFLQMTAAQQHTAALNSPAAAKFLDLKQTADAKLKQNLVLPAAMDQQDKDVLNKDNHLTATAKQKLYASDPKAQYQYDVAAYQRDKLEGKYSSAEQAVKENSLAKEKIGSAYSQDLRDVYGMSQDNMAKYLASNPSQDTINNLYNYDKALKDAGIIKTSKFKNYAPGQTSDASDSGTKKTISIAKPSYGSVKSAPKPTISIASSGKGKVAVKARTHGTSGKGTLKIKKG